jgi:hypothetical protein
VCVHFKPASTCSNFASTVVLSFPMMTTMATAIPQAISAYSIEVAPEPFFKNRKRKFCTFVAPFVPGTTARLFDAGEPEWLRIGGHFARSALIRIEMHG